MDWKSDLEGLRGLRIPAEPGIPALLVIDMQKYFCQPGAPAYSERFSDIVPEVNFLIKLFENANLPIFATRYYSRGKEDPTSIWWDATLEKDSQWVDIDPRIQIPDTATILDKHLYGTFSSTELDRKLKDLGCDTVIICGVMTDLCCETTAREAFQAGYRVLFAADGTATSNDFLHMGALGTLAHGFAFIMDVNEITALLGGLE